MENNILDKKYSLKSLLKEYHRIEIPILQRDYAQGREDKNTTEIRDNIVDYILTALEKNESKELDFVYGTTRNYKDKEGNIRQAFIPLDGQQRLTTLWLLYWYLAYRNNISYEELEFLKDILERFTYENRTSSKDFMKALCSIQIPHTENLKDYIIYDTDWFDEAWLLDPSVKGFLTMLDTFENHPKVKDSNNLPLLYDNLVNKELLTFYFLPLKNFGLGEEIYTRMNARGKILNKFEVFKSNFYKIIDNSNLKNEITKKIEYDWVQNLWPYKAKNIYIVDTPFLNWLRYITQMIYISSPDIKIDENEENKTDYLSFDVLNQIYSKDSNLEFLIHSFDRIPDMANFPTEISLTWESEKRGLNPAIKEILKNPKFDGAVYSLVVYCVLKFMQCYKNSDNTLDLTGLNDYIRIIRNLIENTPDRGKREWIKIIPSLEKLISKNVYKTLQEIDSNNLQGLRVSQRELEIFKAKVILRKDNSTGDYSFQSDAFEVFKIMDDDFSIRARETNFLIALYNKFSSSIIEEINELLPENVDIKTLKKLYNCYCSLRSYKGEDDFFGIWGDLIPTSFYQVSDYDCVWNDNGDRDNTYYRVCPIIVEFAIETMNNNLDVDKMLIKRQKRYIKNLIAKSQYSLRDVIDVKSQLYILYVATIRCIGTRFNTSTVWDFFSTDNYYSKRKNFSWVPRENEYSTPFDHMINFEKKAQIFQTIPSYLKNNYIIDWRTPAILKVGNRKNNFLEIIAEWANS